MDHDGTHAREAVMSELVQQRASGTDGPIVVITGAFHTLALLEFLDGVDEAAWLGKADLDELALSRPAWLIRFDFARLDSLRGYGAGMPAPGFWQRVWSGRDKPADEVTMGVLLDIAEAIRRGGEQLSTPDVIEAAEQALRLAELRGRTRPGRTDVLDAMSGCFVRDESGFRGPVGAAITEVFGGTQLGEVPPGLASPPLIEEVRERARKLRLVISDASVRTVSLDTARKPGHVRRREFLAQMRLSGSGFARQVSGADLVAGTDLGLIHEEWEYAWTPSVEAALIAMLEEGGTLREVLHSRTSERMAEALTSRDLATLLTELAVSGVEEEIPEVIARLKDSVDDEHSVDSTLASLQAVAWLVADEARISLTGYSELLCSIIETGLANVAYHVSSLGGLPEDEADEACQTVLKLRELLVFLGSSSKFDMIEVEAPMRELSRLRDEETSSQLHGCLVGIAHEDGDLDVAGLMREVRANLHPGVAAGRLSGFVGGLLRASPGAILHSAEFLETLNSRLGELDENSFLQVLPELRKAFTWLRPTETHDLATRIAELVGTTAGELDVVMRIDPADITRARAVELSLVESFVRDGIEVPPL